MMMKGGGGPTRKQRQMSTRPNAADTRPACGSQGMYQVTPECWLRHFPSGVQELGALSTGDPNSIKPGLTGSNLYNQQIKCLWNYLPKT